MSGNRLTVVLAGCGGMGRNQARILKQHPDFELVGVCDVSAERAGAVAGETGVRAYPALEAALEKERPDTVAVTSDNASHARLTIAAALAGVKGVYCEKPMATNMADARAMVAACRAHGAVLVVNHQRRLGADLVRMRELVEQGAIGRPLFIRGDCGGDFLSDGTHMVDSLLWVTGDRDATWVMAGLHREMDDSIRDRAAKQGVEPLRRYGHPIENGGMAVVQIADGPRLELFWGDLRTEFRHYQVYQAFGTTGSLWRAGDQAQPNLFIQDAQGGPLQLGTDESWLMRPLPAADGRGMWRAVEGTGPGANLIVEGYTRFAASIRTGAPHPMDGDNALRGFEIVMAVYESARLSRKLRLPIQQDRFPLELMVAEGRA